ncbi:hypothetical protein PINS_up010723 [Pythium insidiosum]|nr:hypothetical protein PINS_up010723 [Pythium insidiosum]
MKPSHAARLLVASMALAMVMLALLAVPTANAQQRRRRPPKIPHYILFDDGQTKQDDGESTPGVVTPPTYEDDGSNGTDSSSDSPFAWRLRSDAERTLTGVSADPKDPLASMRGSGSIAISTTGMLMMKGSPRYYVTAPAPIAGGVEMVAYARLTDTKSSFKDIAGMTMVTRSNHAQSKRDPCQALGYYSRIYFGTGEFAFQKELYHDEARHLPIYTASRRQKIFDDGRFPINRWIGMKFVVLPDTERKSVTLRGFVDLSERGEWRQVFETVDDGGWKATQPLPTACPHADDEIILRAARDSYFRTDDVEALEWRELSVRAL